MSINKRIALLCGFLLLLMIMMAVSCYTLVNKMDDNFERIVNNNFVRIEMAHVALAAVLDVGTAVRSAALIDNPVVRERSLEEVRAGREQYKTATTKIGELDRTERGSKMLVTIKETVAPAAAANNTVLELAKTGRRNDAVTVVVSEGIPLTNKVRQSYKELLDYQKEQAQFRYKEASGYAHFAKTLSVLLALLSLVVGTVSALFLSRSITCPVRSIADQAERIAGGDLTVEIGNHSKDELGALASTFRTMVADLNSTVTHITTSSCSVTTAATQLHGNAHDIAAGIKDVEAQATILGTASEEMAATSVEIAQNCQLAAKNSILANQAAQTGSAVVQENIDGMKRIAQRVQTAATTVEMLGTCSQQIGDIVGTIEDIADQTNLLALNAAIEAARAGEQGRGFAVVADEVRALAQRTTKATREIGEMIKTIQDATQGAIKGMGQGVSEVESGLNSSYQSEVALKDIVERINDVTTQINQIATAAEEQSATVREITQNIQQVGLTLSQASGSILQTSGAIEQLTKLSEELIQRVRKFRLREPAPPSPGDGPQQSSAVW